MKLLERIENGPIKLPEGGKNKNPAESCTKNKNPTENTTGDKLDNLADAIRPHLPATQYTLPDGSPIDFARMAAAGFLPVPCPKCPRHSPIDWEDLQGTLRCFGCEPPPIPAMIGRLVLRVTHPSIPAEDAEVVGTVDLKAMRAAASAAANEAT